MFPFLCRVVLTDGICALGEKAKQDIIGKVRCFDDFTPDNDPYEEHDFGAFDHDGQKIFWKIDLYDRNYEYGSDDPENPDVTRRVLTIMLAHECAPGKLA